MAPRTVAEILAQADQLAKRFEGYEPAPGDVRDAAPLRAIREAFEDLAHAEKRLADRVADARSVGLSWAAVATMLGTSGEAARQRYGQPSAPTRKAVAAPAATKTARAKVTKATGRTATRG